MNTPSLQEFFEQYYSDCLGSVSDISRSSRESPILLNSDVKMYDFDEISKRIHSRKPFQSAYGLRFIGNRIELIEFKTGFARRITKDNWNPEIAQCPRYHVECTDFRDQFFRVEKLEIKELIRSINEKAVDSYLTWEKHILPRIQTGSHTRLEYIVVIDGDSTDKLEDILGSLAYKKSSPSNYVSRVRNSLTRLIGCRDVDHKPYFYDEIKVFTFGEYQTLLNRENAS